MATIQATRGTVSVQASTQHSALSIQPNQNPRTDLNPSPHFSAPPRLRGESQIGGRL
jgi:hypothetical protein